MKIIIKLIALFCTLLIFGVSSASSQNNITEKYIDMDGVTSVYISKAMFKMISLISLSVDEQIDLEGIVHKIESMQILSCDKERVKDKMYNDYLSQVSKSYEELMRVKKDNNFVTIYVKQKGNIIKELLMLSKSNTKTAIIQLVGNFTMEDIQKITKNVDVK